MDHENPEPALESSPPLIPSFEMVNGLSRKQNKEWFDVSESTTAELKKQVQLAGPLVVVSFVQYSLQMISVMFIGHLGGPSLSSASLAISFTEVTGFSFMLGMGGIGNFLWTSLWSKAVSYAWYTRAETRKFLWTFTGYIFTICGQDQEISAQAGIFARWLIPSIFPYGHRQRQLGFFQTQNYVKPLLISTVITSLVHILVRRS